METKALVSQIEAKCYGGLFRFISFSLSRHRLCVISATVSYCNNDYNSIKYSAVLPDINIKKVAKKVNCFRKQQQHVFFILFKQQYKHFLFQYDWRLYLLQTPFRYYMIQYL